MPKYVVLDGRVLEANLKFGSLEAAMAKAKHEVQKHQGEYVLYIAQLITSFSGEIVSREVPIGVDSEESE